MAEFWEDEIATIRFNNFKNVINELKTYINDYRLGVRRVFDYKKVKVYKSGNVVYFEWNSKFYKISGVCGGTIFDCCWGSVDTNNKYSKFDPLKPMYFKLLKDKCGIEVLNNRENKRMLGKGFTIKELKEKCKINKLKKYSKLDKLQLLGLLMTI